MKKSKVIVAGLAMLMLSGIGFDAPAQTRTDNQSMMMNDNKRGMNLVSRLETSVDRFKNTVNTAFDRNRLDGTELEDELLARVEAFEFATDRLRERVDDNEVITSDVENVLTRALFLDSILQKVPKSKIAQQDWMQTRKILDELGQTYKVAWVWTLDSNPYWKTASVEPIFDRLELRSDEFRRSFNDALDRSKLNGTDLENQAVELVRSFEDNIDRLEDMVDRRETLKGADIEAALQRALAIEAFMRTHNLSIRSRRDWAQVKANLNELAWLNKVAWTWTVKPVATTPSR